MENNQFNKHTHFPTNDKVDDNVDKQPTASSFDSCDTSEENDVNGVKTGPFMLVTFKTKKTIDIYAGLITYTDASEIEVPFLHANDSSKKIFAFLEKEDRAWVMKNQAKKVFPTPSMDNQE